MTARLVCVLHCDADGCDRRFVWSEAERNPPRIGLARRAAAVEGWRHAIRVRFDSGPAPTFDFCPQHAVSDGLREVTA